MNETKEIFEKAVACRNEEYISYEKQLLQSDKFTTLFLKEMQRHDDPGGRLLARVIEKWNAGKNEIFNSALSYLYVDIVNFIKGTPVMAPPSDGVAAYLTKNYQGQVTQLLTLRLIKEDWPQWRVYGVLIYLRKQKDPSCTEGLLRFAVDTSNKEWQNYAIETIELTNVSDLPRIIEAERKRCKLLNKPFPIEANSLSQIN